MFLTREQIVRALGEVDDVMIAQIIATGATADELAEAQAWLENNEPLLNSGRRLPAGRVGHLADMLITLEEESREAAGSSE
jgi:hypothetical protein